MNCRLLPFAGLSEKGWTIYVRMAAARLGISVAALTMLAGCGFGLRPAAFDAAPATDLANRFAESLAEEDYSAAYALLSEQTRRDTPRDQFVDARHAAADQGRRIVAFDVRAPLMVDGVHPDKGLRVPLMLRYADGAQHQLELTVIHERPDVWRVHFDR